MHPVLDVLRNLGGGLLDLLYPPRCLVCDTLAHPFCDECHDQIRRVDGRPGLPRELDDVRSVGYHEGALRRAVLRLKFGRKTALAGPLGGLLADELQLVSSLWRPEALVPVPIHWSRRLDRGFNQAELLADAASRGADVPVLAALQRVRATPPQVGRTREERLAGLHQAFALRKGVEVAGARLVLVDDVRTTGATLGSCAELLRQAGAGAVFGLTLSYDE